MGYLDNFGTLKELINVITMHDNIAIISLKNRFIETKDFDSLCHTMVRLGGYILIGISSDEYEKIELKFECS